MYLSEIQLPLSKLKGIGPAGIQLFSNLGVISVLDLLFFLPRDYEDRRKVTSFQSASSNETAALCTITVKSHEWIGKNLSTLKMVVEDHEGTELSLMCFNRDFYKTQFPVGAKGHYFGPVSWRYQELQSSQFELLPLTSDKPQPPNLGKVLGIYPLTAGLKQTQVRRAVEQAVAMTKDLTEEIPADIRETLNLQTWHSLFRAVHQPENLEFAETARKALVWRELYFLTGVMLLRKKDRVSKTTTASTLPRGLYQKALSLLPFPLTSSQKNSCEEILQDLESGRTMNRLLQGDVGSGKTLIAFLTALPLIEAGAQVAFLAPTELLAHQHAENAYKYLAPAGVKLGFLTASVTSRDRAEFQKNLQNGSLQFVFGTHALLSEDLVWKNLCYVIVDEQQRFGVQQREKLLQKGKGIHLLMMSATPIPRSLALSVFGDLDVSTLTELPPGRTPITTYLSLQSHLERVYEFVSKQLEQGHQAYFIFPIIEESEKRALMHLTKAVEEIKSAFPAVSVGSIHGKMRDEDKLEAMHSFAEGKTHILCATSVVEVGVDVPNATCITIVHSEIFGLSALHQLRGRVGRGTIPGFCFLVYADTLTETAKDRLKILRSTSDGFQIAEEDLHLRGPGEVLGNRQAGALKLRAADLSKDGDVLFSVRNSLLELMKSDPQGEWEKTLREYNLFRGELR